MHINGTINAFICINNHVNSCLNCMLSYRFVPHKYYIIFKGNYIFISVKTDITHKMNFSANIL